MEKILFSNSLHGSPFTVEKYDDSIMIFNKERNPLKSFCNASGEEYFIFDSTISDLPYLFSKSFIDGLNDNDMIHSKDSVNLSKYITSRPKNSQSMYIVIDKKDGITLVNRINGGEDVVYELDKEVSSRRDILCKEEFDKRDRIVYRVKVKDFDNFYGSVYKTIKDKNIKESPISLSKTQRGIYLKDKSGKEINSFKNLCGNTIYVLTESDTLKPILIYEQGFNKLNKIDYSYVIKDTNIDESSIYSSSKRCINPVLVCGNYEDPVYMTSTEAYRLTNKRVTNPTTKVHNTNGYLLKMNKHRDI